MPQGYDNRQAGRQSFAFAPVAPRQTQVSAAPPQMGRTGVVGAGEARGGVVMSQSPAIGAGIGSNIPAFLEAVFEPIVKEKSAERMYQGYADAVAGKTMDEIAAEKPQLAGLFGQSDFQAGASFFHAQNGMQQWQAEQLANMDQLKRMDPDQVGKVLFEAASPHLTGDPTTDNVIHRMVIESSQELLPRVAAARIEWRREEYRKGATGAATTAANNYSTLIDQMNLGDTPPTPEQLDAAKTQYLSTMLPVVGMPDEDWVSVVEQVARTTLASGNLAAFNAMNEGGNESLLFMALGATGDGAKYQTLQNLADTASKKALSDWATDVRVTVNDASGQPVQVNPIDVLASRMAAQEIVGGDIRVEMEKINDWATKETNATVPYYTEEEIAAAVGGYVRSKASEDRADARVEATARATERVRQEAEAATLSAIDRALTQRDPQAVILEHGAAKVDQVARARWQTDPAGTIPILEGIFANRNTTFPETARDIQGLITSNITAGASSAGFQKALGTWSAFTNTAARAYYFGPELDAKFNAYSRRTTGPLGVQPLEAWSETFGQAGALPGTVGPGRAPVGATGAEITDALKKTQPNFLARMFGPDYPTSPNEFSMETLTRWVAPEAGNLMAQRGYDAEQAVAVATAGLQSNRQIDRAGAYVWATPQRTPSMEQLTGVPQDRLARSLDRILDTQLELSGNDGVDRNKIRVIPNVDGVSQNSWFFSYETEDGQPRGFTVTPDMIKARDREDLAVRREGLAAASVTDRRAEAFGYWISEPGLSFGDRNRRVNQRGAFLRGEFDTEVNRIVAARGTTQRPTTARPSISNGLDAVRNFLRPGQ